MEKKMLLATGTAIENIADQFLDLSKSFVFLINKKLSVKLIDILKDESGDNMISI